MALVKLLDAVEDDVVGTTTLDIRRQATIQAYSADFDGGTVTIEGAPINPDGTIGNYVSLGGGAEFTSSGWVTIFIRGHMRIRAVLAGSGGGPSPLTVTVL